MFTGTESFAFKDLDENKPAGSIKIRVETIDYFLRRYREDMVRKAERVKQIEDQLAEYERRFREELLGTAVTEDAAFDPVQSASPYEGRQTLPA